MVKSNKKIGIITTNPKELENYFPTQAEPNFVATDPHYTPDDELLVKELLNNGFDVVPIIWGKHIDDIHSFMAFVVRSPWGYMTQLDSEHSFFRWLTTIEQSQANVYNPIQLMTWLLDKHYLRDLQQQGVNIIPTTYFHNTSPPDLKKQLHEKGKLVIKPCIGAGGGGLHFIESENDCDITLSDCDYMLQPYQPEIKTKGEWSCTFIAGEYSHSIHKLPAEHSILVQAEHGGSLDFKCTPNDNLLSFAHHAYKKIIPAFERATGKHCHPNDILYMRLDIVETAAGPVLIECEGVEPELFFRAHPASINAFCQALRKRTSNSDDLIHH